MSNLIESILSEDFVSASELFESRIEEIVEQKLLEAKKQVQAEAMGGMSKQDIEDRKKAGFIKASHYFDVMNKLKEIEQEHKEKLKKPKSGKKKLDEQETFHTKSQAELEKMAKAGAERIGKQFGKTAQAMKASSAKHEPEKSKEVSPAVSTTASTKKRKTAPSEPSETRAKSFKYLSGNKVGLRIKPRLSAADQYEKGLKQAKDFEARGREGAVNKFRGSKAAVKYRAGREAKGFASAMGGFAKNIISGLGGLYEEENN
jgi:hypothetical protein